MTCTLQLGTVEKLGGYRAKQRMTGRVFRRLGIRNGMGIASGGERGRGASVDVLEIDRPGDLGDLANLGLTYAVGKQLLSQVQQAVVAAQCRDYAAHRPVCPACGGVCRVKVYRPRQIATLFGTVTLRLPRFRCAGCQGEAAGSGDRRSAARRPSSIRSGRSFPPSCRTVSRPASCSRSRPGPPPKPCAPTHARSARTCGTPPGPGR